MDNIFAEDQGFIPAGELEIEGRVKGFFRVKADSRLQVAGHK